MRFESVRVASYGCLKGLATGEDPLPQIVAVLGPNESGKSTLIDMLTTILYGFRPASRERHPYSPWSGADAEGRAALRMDDGGVVEVHRRLASTPRGTATAGGERRTIANRSLPETGHVARVVFQQVYALTLAELAGLERESWDLVQDRLVSAMAAPDLRPARMVVAELEGEAARLWRPDRRGRPRARIVRERIQQLSREHREAVERDRALRAKAAARERGAAELAGLRAELAELRKRRGELERLAQLAPVRGRLARIRELKRRAGARGDLEGLPGDPAKRRAELRGALGAAAERIDSLRGVAGVVGREEDGRRLGEVAGRVLAVPLSEVDPEVFSKVKLGELGDAVRLYRSRRSERRIAEEGLHDAERFRLAGAAPSGGWRLALWIACFGLGGGAAWVARHAPDLLRPVPGIEASPEAVLWIGFGLGLLGSVFLFLWLEAKRQRRGHRRRLMATRRDWRSEIQRLQHGEHIARQRIVKSLGGLPVLEELIRDPDHELHATIERIVELVGERDGRDEAARGQLEKIESELRRLDAERDSSALALEALEDRLKVIGDGDLVRGEAEAKRRLRALARARDLEGEVAREHPDLAEVEARVRSADEVGVGWASLGASLEDADRRIAELGRLAEEQLAAIATLDAEVDHLERGETADRVQGCIEAARRELDEVRERRDRAFLLARVLAEADRRFREAHQPDLLPRAAGYLQQITLGRYDRIELAEGDGQSLQLLGRAASEPRSVGRLSQGTREQVYMALRLAVIDHLDAEGERLPIFMDEALVNWDAWRRDRALELLERVAEHRQVFVFTCHPAVAADLEDRGGRIVALARS